MELYTSDLMAGCTDMFLDEDSSLLNTVGEDDICHGGNNNLLKLPDANLKLHVLL